MQGVFSANHNKSHILNEPS